MNPTINVSPAGLMADDTGQIADTAQAVGKSASINPTRACFIAWWP